MRSTPPPCGNERDPFDGKYMDELIFDDDRMVRKWFTRRHYFGYDRVEYLEKLYEQCKERNVPHLPEIEKELYNLKKREEDTIQFIDEKLREVKEKLSKKRSIN